MHRDAKLGLAMAILVIGFAAALCFPREDLKDQADLTLESAAVLDAEIGLTSAKLYTPKPVEPTIPASQPIEEVLPAEPVPTPIEPTTGISSQEPTPIDPGIFPAERIEERPPVREQPKDAEPERVHHTRQYLVKYGDSLSQIAEHELGDEKYYKQILNANRDRISNPDSLKPGMILEIPIPEGSSDLSESAPTDERAVEPDAPVAAPNPASRPTQPAPSAPQSAPRTKAAGRFGPPRLQ